MKELELKIDISDLENIYFGNGNGDIFFGPAIKKTTYYTLLSFAGFASIVFYAINSKSLWMILISFIGVVSIVNTWWNQASPILEWRKSVKVFIENSKNVRQLSIKYDHAHIIHIQDEIQTKVYWSEVIHAEISDRFILIEYPGSSMMLPASSFEKSDYAHLSEIVFKNCRNVVSSVNKEA